jgi:prophage regulatory protein
MAQPKPRPDRLLRKPEVLARIGLTDGQLRRLEEAGRFPRRIKLGLRSVGWVEAEIEQWIARSCAERRVRLRISAAEDEAAA